MTDDFIRHHDSDMFSAGGANSDSINSTETGDEGSGMALGQAGATVVVERPAPGQTVQIQTAADHTYVLNFPPQQAQVEVQGDNFVLDFDDDGDGTADSRIVFLDFVDRVEAGEAPSFQIGDATVGGELLLRQTLALAGEDEPPLDDVAGGPGALGGGGTAYSDDVGNTIGLLNAEDVILPTELQFGLIELEEEITLLDVVEAVAEQNPALNITKTALGVDGGEGQVADEAGDVITYAISVENTGDQTLTNVVVADPDADTLARQADLVGDNDDELEVGEVWSYIATHTVTQAEIDNNGGGDGDIDNMATVDSDQTGPDEASAEVAIAQNPALNITKAAVGVDGGEGLVVDEAGDVIDYTITVENTGNQTLTNVVVTDPNADTLVRGADLAGDNDDELEVGETWSYTATHTVTQAEIDDNGGGDGDIDNTATADSDQTGPDEAGAEVPIRADPSLNVTKAADVTSVSAVGAVIAYAIAVENTGNLSLTNVTIDDPLTDDEAPVLVDGFNAGDSDQDGALDVGETWQYTATYTVTQADFDSDGGGDGDIDNTVTADSDQTGPDSASASVTIVQPPVLIVGENVDDVDGETTPHRVHSPASDEDTGAILGDDAGDLLIGDVGGSSLAGNIMNLVLVLDTSDSMDAEITFNGVSMSRIEALDLALEQLLDGIAGTEGATVRVHLVSFASNVKEVGTFDIVVGGVIDNAALQAAKDFVLAAGDSPTAIASGNTNYEAGFTAALDWFSDSGNTLDNPAFNQTIFISDGLPNRAYRGDGTTNVVAPGAQVAVDHVLGQVDMDGTVNDDTISEFDGLLGSFEGVAGTVDAIGINVGQVALDRLHQLDGNSASSINTGEQLLEELNDLTKLQLAGAGGDVIFGADGDDVIFGDSLFTDLLAADEGVALPAGSGWSVIEALAGNGFFDTDVSKSVEEEIMDFLRDPANQAAYDFGAESELDGSVREDGNDLIDGGGGADLIFGQEGDDTLLGGTGDDTLFGGSGADSFTWGAETSAGEADIVADFETGPGGDALDLSALLSGVGAGDGGDALDAWLQVSFDGTDTTIGVDANGDGSGFTDVTVTVQGVDLTGGIATQAGIIDSLLGDGSLQVA